MKKTCLSLSVVVLLACSGVVQAQVIIYDQFNQAPGGGITGLAGQSPNTDLPGSTWNTEGTGVTFEVAADSFFGPTYELGNPNPVSYGLVNFDTAELDLTGYNSGTLTLSAYVNNASGGAGYLGFANSYIGDPSIGFYGLMFDNSGMVYRNLNGTITSVAFGGAYDPSKLSQLSFTVDTSTGDITAISFQGSSADYSSLLGGGAIGTTETSFLYLKGTTSTDYADLTLMAGGSPPLGVPEPSTWATLLGGCAFLALPAVRRRLGLAA